MKRYLITFALLVILVTLFVLILGKEPAAYRVFYGKRLPFPPVALKLHGRPGACINFSPPADYLVYEDWLIPLVGPYAGWALKKDGCWRGFKLSKPVEWPLNYTVVNDRGRALDYNNHTLYVRVRTNCCGMRIDVRRREDEVLITAQQVGEPCKCFCDKTLAILNVPAGVRVIFYDGQNQKVLAPAVYSNGFCGISTYGYCENDEDCMVDGCSGEVCRSVRDGPMATPCLWRDCYGYGKPRCVCVNHQCQWQ